MRFISTDGAHFVVCLCVLDTPIGPAETGERSRYASAASSYDPVSVRPSLTSRCSIETAV